MPTDIIKDPALRTFVHHHIAAILVGMAVGGVSLFIIFSIGPDRYFFDLHQSIEDEHAIMRASAVAVEAQLEEFDDRMENAEIQFIAHGEEYDELADMLESQLSAIQQTVQQTAADAELSRREDALTSQLAVLRGQVIRLKRIVDGDGVAPPTQNDITQYARLQTEVETLEAELARIRTQQ